MQIKKVFNLMMLLVGTTFTTAYGSYYQQGCYDNTPLGSGWFIGIYGAFDAFYINSKDTTVQGPNAIQERYEMIHRAPGGGGYVGWACDFCDRFSLGFQFAGTGYASSAQHTSVDSDFLDGSANNETRIKYSFDLSLLPGVLLGDCILLYTKIGASVIGMKRTYRLFDNSPFMLINQVRKNDHEWGVIFGGGVQAAISRCLSAFTEFVWHSYPSHVSVSVISDNDSNVKSSLTSIFSFGFRAGLGWMF